MYHLTLSLCLFASLSSTVYSYNILGIFSIPARSHFNFIEPLLIRLSEKGHNVTSFNPFPKNHQIPNYTHISLEGCIPVQSNVLTVDAMLKYSENAFLFALMMPMSNFSPESFDACQPLIQLFQSNQRPTHN